MSARQIMTPDLAAPVPVAARVVEAQELAPLSAGMGPEKPAEKKAEKKPAEKKAEKKPDSPDYKSDPILGTF
jgi:hypothetical protein